MNRILFLFLVLSLAVPTAGREAAAQRLPLIRDAETERVIRDLAAPVFAAAGLSTDFVEVHLVNDSTLNAFVGGGQRIFINTGLILEAEKPRQITAVIAHETGHIAGGHLARTREALRGATAQSIAAVIIGAAAVVVGGGRGGAAVLGGGAQIAQRSLLLYSRTQESAADQAALRYLQDIGQSGRGLVEVLEMLGTQEPLLRTSQDPYTRSHPLSRERLNAVTRIVAAAPEPAPDPQMAEAYARIRAKLQGYIERPRNTFRIYPESDTSIPAVYARALAHHQSGDTARALEAAGLLLDAEPDNPFFHELNGQIFYENGRLDEARHALEEAVRLAPHEALLRIGLAQTQIALNEPGFNRDAIVHLEEAVRIDRNSTAAWRSLAIAYGRDGRFGMSSLASAERAFLIGDHDSATTHARRAEDQLPVGSPGALRAGDILNAAGQ